MSCRNFLREEEAIKIFEVKILNDNSPFSERIRAAELSRVFGVSIKAIRDIWSRRTWSKETKHLILQEKSSCNLLTTDEENLLASKVEHSHKNASPFSLSEGNFLNCDSLTTLEKCESLKIQDDFGRLDSWRSSSRDDESLKKLWADDPFHDDWPFWDKKFGEECDSI